MYIPANAVQSADCPTWDEAAAAASFLYRFAKENARQTWHLYIRRHHDLLGQDVWGVWHTEQLLTSIPRQTARKAVTA